MLFRRRSRGTWRFLLRPQDIRKMAKVLPSYSTVFTEMIARIYFLGLFLLVGYCYASTAASTTLELNTTDALARESSIDENPAYFKYQDLLKVSNLHSNIDYRCQGRWTRRIYPENIFADVCGTAVRELTATNCPSLRSRSENTRNHGTTR